MINFAGFLFLLVIALYILEQWRKDNYAKLPVTSKRKYYTSKHW